MLKDIETIPIKDLRENWKNLWGIEPPARIGRLMLEKSIHFKRAEKDGGLSKDNQEKLKYFVQQYKRNQSCFDLEGKFLKPGTRLVRTHHGKKHCVIVKVNGFEYQGRLYNSLSKIAGEITDKNWNGWLFFGLKKAQKS